MLCLRMNLDETIIMTLEDGSEIRLCLLPNPKKYGTPRIGIDAPITIPIKRVKRVTDGNNRIPS